MRRLMGKLREKKGFTLAELLIVVAIIAVLVAIAIPIFTNQLEKAREATDVANIRDYYAEVAVALLDGTLDKDHTSATMSGGVTATYATGSGSYTVSLTLPKVNQTQSTWQSGDQEVAGYKITSNTDMVGKTTVTFTFTTPTNGNDYLSAITFS